MSEQLKKRWDEFQNNAISTLDQLNEDSKKWFSELEKIEQTTAGLILEINKEIEKSGKEARKTWKQQLEKAKKAREEARKGLEDKIEALRRSEEHLKKAIDELR